ncbi:protein SCAI-like [Olea europaea var. sylvestris]|uniref:protein SCAI-like n=1 Tax=Olea europaea var. sylvestris TaxID=158386 RepID=UPI000C1CF61B|nr:protein SCAI-like [Olea europaea var. sylvestris]
MSLNQSNISNSTNTNVSVIELYWNLVAKADKKFSKIRDLPYYQRTRYDTYFYKVFKVYTQLWKFQQENRQKLVEAGLKRWEIGEIASRIGQLYFGQYMRTSEASYLSESYIFYEAILTREYFKEGLYQDINLASKQLRFLARFLTVCLVFNRREVVYQLVNQLKMLLDECKRTFQETDFKEWKLVIQEIVKFLKADTAFMNIRPLRYSVVLDLQPNSLPHVDAPRKLKLRDALLCSYHPNEVKFSELTLDTFRMLQCLEWEPSGLFYQTNMDASSDNVTNASQNGTPGSNRVNQDITDPTLAPNPRKAVLYRPSVTHFMAVLGTVCEELAPDGILLIYLSASGRSAHTLSSPSRVAHSIGSGFQFHSINSESTSAHPTSFGGDSADLHSGQIADCLHIGARGNGGMNCIYPCDLLPFTRRPLFLIIDSDSSQAFKAISGTEKGERIAMLLSPATSMPIPAIDSTRQPSGSSFTSFLTAPLQSFILLLGFSGSDVETDMYNKAEKLLYSSLNQWGLSLASSDNLDPVWAQILSDPFLRRLLLRFVFCRAVLSLYVPSSGRIEFLPECVPCLPDDVSPTSAKCQASVSQLADIIGARDKFIFSQETRTS